MDLRDLFRPRGGRSRLTWRRLGVLIDHLPGESPLKTAIRDALPAGELAAMSRNEPAGHGPWSRTDLLLAEVIDRVRDVEYVVASANAAKNQRPKRPQPYPRPGVGGGKQPVTDDARAEVHARMEEIRARNEAERQRAIAAGEVPDHFADNPAEPATTDGASVPARETADTSEGV